MAYTLGVITMLTLTNFLMFGTNAQDPGTILQPTSGTNIAPGTQFNFSYFGRADYGVSSYNYHVWLVGEDLMNDSLGTKDVLTTGWYFGTFDYNNWPGEFLIFFRILGRTKVDVGLVLASCSIRKESCSCVFHDA